MRFVLFQDVLGLVATAQSGGFLIGSPKSWTPRVVVFSHNMVQTQETPGEPQDRWRMDVPPQNGAIGFAVGSHQWVLPTLRLQGRR